MADDMQATSVPKLEATLEKLLDRANVAAVFGEPVTENGITVIPVADVFFGMGFGYGRGPAGEASGEDAAEESSGGGAGGGGRARPVGVVRISEKGARFEPVVDPTRMAIGGMALAAWTVFWIGLVVKSAAKALARK